MINLFTYGSLMCSDIMYKVAGCRFESDQAILNDFYRSKIQNEEYPGIVPQSGSKVSGVLYLALSPEALQRLDLFEGELYQRQEVGVLSENHGRVRAMTYVIKPGYGDLLTGETWSFNHFLAVGKKKFQASYLGFQGI